MDAGGGSCVTSYLQCGGRLGTHTGWTEILWTCPRAVCTGVHPSLLGHRILGVVSRFKRLDQDVEQGQPRGRMGHLTALKDLRQKGFVIPGSDGTSNLGAYSVGSGEALEEGESPRPRRYPRRHVTGAPTRVRYAVCRTGSIGDYPICP